MSTCRYTRVVWKVYDISVVDNFFNQWDPSTASPKEEV